MALLDRLAPGWAARRARARADALRWRHVQNAYEATQPGPQRRRTPRSGHPARDAIKSGKDLADFGRDAEQNNDIARGALDVLVTRTVGMGIMPTPSIKRPDGTPHEEANRLVRRKLERWAKVPDVTGEHHYAHAQRLLCRSAIRDGEAFKKRHMGTVRNLRHGTDVPLSIELTEAEFVPRDFHDTRRKILGGIERNDWGRPLALWFYRDHPANFIGMPVRQNDLKRTPADMVDHLAMRDRIGQNRGVSLFASVIRRLDDLKEIDESERVAARVAAAMAAYIKKGNPDQFDPNDYSDKDEDKRELDWKPGIIFDDLLPGEEIGTVGSQRPNNQLIPFRDDNLRGFAAGFGISHSSASKKFDGTFSSQRQELVEQWDVYGIVWQWFVERAVVPDYESFVRMMELTGQLPGGIDRETLFDASYSRPVMPWIDPDKESRSEVRRINALLRSPQDAIRARGGNPDDVLDEARQWQDDTRDLRQSLDSQGEPEPVNDPPEE